MLTEAGKSCECGELDRKKKPATSQYVSALGNRIAWLESFITRIKASRPEERDAILNDAGLSDDHLRPGSELDTQSNSTPENTQRRQDNLEQGPEDALNYHCPTSILHARLSRSKRESNPHSLDKPPLPHDIQSDAKFERVAAHFDISLDNELVAIAFNLLVCNSWLLT